MITIEIGANLAFTLLIAATLAFIACVTRKG